MSEYLIALIFGVGFCLSLVLSKLSASARVAFLTLCFIGTLLNLLALAIMPFFHLTWVKFLFSFSFYKLLIYLLGGFLTGGMIKDIWKRDFFPGKEKLVRATCFLMASYFMGTGLGKYLFWESMASFFARSGYPVWFLTIITIIEIGCAIALLFRKTEAIAAIVLSMVMIGATWTHYHNYFDYGIPYPFGNSIDSLKMQSFLVFIFCYGRHIWKSKLRSHERS